MQIMTSDKQSHKVKSPQTSSVDDSVFSNFSHPQGGDNFVVSQSVKFWVRIFFF
jgi:hypothetical protein